MINHVLTLLGQLFVSHHFAMSQQILRRPPRETVWKRRGYVKSLAIYFYLFSINAQQIKKPVQLICIADKLTGFYRNGALV